jgi:hypothetical protein
MPDRPLTRDAWVNDFVVEVQRQRPDLVHSLKYLNAVAQTEWARSSGKDDPHEAARQWNRRVKSARP